MMHEDWSRLRTLFDEALERPAAEREAFISSLGSDRMAHELRELLAAHDGSGPFDRLMDEISGSGVEQLLHLEPGDELGAYRVVREIGRGGMAVVYEAFDVRHERQVAVKVLRPELAALIGADRFVQEMRTTAKLQHPHIIPLFDSGESDGYLFYVMPYVEGESLREKLNREGRLGLEEAVGITTDVADALDCAHQHGVIHRDVKPGNVLLYEGRPMVSDFGIALAMSVTVDGRAGAGVPLGTPDYMSPEQAEGRREITHRSDIYSLGCMLYEMLTGNRPFGRDSERSVSEQHAAEPVPDIRTVRPSVPEPVSRAIMMAMAKAPADRYETAGELAQAIQPPEEVSAQFRRRYGRFFRRDVRWLVNVAAAVAFLLAGVWLTAEFTGGEGGGAEPAALGMRTRQLTHDGNVIRAAISPDGSMFARAIFDDDDKATARIVVQDIEGALPERVLALTPHGALGDLDWMPDGSGVTFFGAHMGTMGQHLVPVDGGPVQTGAVRWRHARAAGSDRIALWGPQWKQVLLMPTSGWAEGPRAGSLDSIPLSGDYDFIQDVALAPGGGRLIVSTFGGSAGTLRLIDLAEGAETVLNTDYGRLTHLNWVRAGRAFYYTRTLPVGGMQLMRLTFGSDGALNGAPLSVMELADSLWVTHVETDARRLVAVRTLVDSRLVRVSRRPGADSTTVHEVTGGDGAIEHRTSPDGAWIAFMASSVSRGDSPDESIGTGGYDLYRVAAAGGTPERISAHGGIKDFAWSPDGRFIAFTAPYQDTVSVWLVASDGGSPVRLRGSHTNGTVVWAPGPLIYGLPGNRNYEVVRNLRIHTATDTAALTPSNLSRAWNSIVDGDRSPLVGTEDGWMFRPHTSPDGRWAAIGWNRQSGQPGVWRISLSDSAQRLVKADTRDVRYGPDGWAPDGSAIIAVTGSRFVRLPLDGSEPESIFDWTSEPPYYLFCEPPFTPLEFDVHCVELTRGLDAVLIEDFDPQAD